MKKILLALMMISATVSAQNFYEMRVYFPQPGKMAELNARFKNHTIKLFEKHGMKNIGYFVPQSNPDSVLIYFLAYESHSQRDSAWKAFGADPEWKKVQSESEKNGRLVAKVISKFLNPTDFSPNDFSSAGNRVFELRTYVSSQYNLGLLLARFRNHTLKLFEKHGMKNMVYWTEEGKDNSLIYLLTHATAAAQKASFDAFRIDPEWVDARNASEKLAKGSITASVQSLILVPVDYSMWK